MLYGKKLFYLALVFNSSLLFGTLSMLHCKNLSYLALLLNYPFYLALLMCCIAKTSYLALLFNYLFYLALSMCCIANPLLSGACIQHTLLFDTADVLHCKNL